MREIIQLDIIKELLTSYPDNAPLHHFTKEFYRKHRQLGSRDRRFYSDTIYKYFRCKTLFTKLSFEEKLCYSGFLTSAEPNNFHRYLLSIINSPVDLKNLWVLSLNEKLSLLESSGIISWNSYFPGKAFIDKDLDVSEFLTSHLHQPAFFIRVSKNESAGIAKILKEQEVQFTQTKNTFAFESALDISKYLPEGSYEVQDISSQATVVLMNPEPGAKVWDCCSGAGGKSMMLLDAHPNIQLYCSDKRNTILENLKVRMQQAGLKAAGVDEFDAVNKKDDLKFNQKVIPEGFFDMIIADVPCTGSGTWGRTPERLYQFKEEEIKVYAALQKSIIRNIIPYLKPNGQLVYITCSVYATENAEHLNEIEKLGFKIVSNQYFIGYNKQADTLFGAVLQKI